jgi:hypothetical protein
MYHQSKIGGKIAPAMCEVDFVDFTKLMIPR